MAEDGGADDEDVRAGAERGRGGLGVDAAIDLQIALRIVRSINCRNWAMRAGLSGKNACPPKPGCTVMHRAKSIIGKNGVSASIGVSGLIASPTFLPRFLISPMIGLGSGRTS